MFLLITALLVSCGRPSNPKGDTFVRIYGGNVGGATLDQGVIVYVWNQANGQSFSFKVEDENEVFAVDVPNASGYRFMALGAGTASGFSYADFTNLHCSLGEDESGNSVFSLDGGAMNIDFTLSNTNCAGSTFMASRFLNASSGTPKTIEFVSCADASTASTYASGCSAGGSGSIEASFMHFGGEALGNAPIVSFTSACVNTASGSSLQIPSGAQLAPFYTRLIGYASSSCSGGVNNSWDFATGLDGEENNRSQIFDNSTNVKVYLGD